MEPGYQPAPARATRILGPDGVPLSGDVTLNAGNNVGITRAGQVLSVASLAPSPLRAVPAFAPGAAVARVLQRMTAASPVLSALDIMLLTAPVGVSVGNIANVQVRGTSSGGPVVVALTAGVSEYHLGLGDVTTPLAGETATGATAGRAERATAFPFTVSTQVVVKNADAPFSGFSGASDTRLGIATGVAQNVTNVLTPTWVGDGAGNSCFADLASGVVAGSARPLWTFPGSVGFTLNVGTTYWLVVSRLSNNDQLALLTGTTQTSLGNLTNPGAVGVLTDTFSAGHYTDIFDTASGATKYPDFRLFGAVMGTALTGRVEISQTITGAPPGTTGSDANIVAQV